MAAFSSRSRAAERTAVLRWRHRRATFGRLTFSWSHEGSGHSGLHYVTDSQPLRSRIADPHRGCVHPQRALSIEASAPVVGGWRGRARARNARLSAFAASWFGASGDTRSGAVVCVPSGLGRRVRARRSPGTPSSVRCGTSSPASAGADRPWWPLGTVRRPVWDVFAGFGWRGPTTVAAGRPVRRLVWDVFAGFGWRGPTTVAAGHPVRRFGRRLRWLSGQRGRTPRLLGEPSGASADGYVGLAADGARRRGSGHVSATRHPCQLVALAPLQLCPGHAPLRWSHRGGTGWPDPVDPRTSVRRLSRWGPRGSALGAVVAAHRRSSQEFVAVAARFADGSPRQAGLRVRRRLAGLAVFVVKVCAAAPGLALWSQVVSVSMSLWLGLGPSAEALGRSSASRVLPLWRLLRSGGDTVSGPAGRPGCRVGSEGSVSGGGIRPIVGLRTLWFVCGAHAALRWRHRLRASVSWALAPFCTASLTGGHGFARVCHHSGPRFASVRAAGSDGDVVR